MASGSGIEALAYRRVSAAVRCPTKTRRGQTTSRECPRCMRAPPESSVGQRGSSASGWIIDSSSEIESQLSPKGGARQGFRQHSNPAKVLQGIGNTARSGYPSVRDNFPPPTVFVRDVRPHALCGVSLHREGRTWG